MNNNEQNREYGDNFSRVYEDNEPYLQSDDNEIKECEFFDVTHCMLAPQNKCNEIHEDYCYYKQLLKLKAELKEEKEEHNECKFDRNIAQLQVHTLTQKLEKAKKENEKLMESYTYCYSSNINLERQNKSLLLRIKELEK